MVPQYMVNKCDCTLSTSTLEILPVPNNDCKGLINQWLNFLFVKRSDENAPSRKGRITELLDIKCRSEASANLIEVISSLGSTGVGCKLTNLWQCAMDVTFRNFDHLSNCHYVTFLLQDRQSDLSIIDSICKLSDDP
jgi:hypothetical protein